MHKPGICNLIAIVAILVWPSSVIAANEGRNLSFAQSTSYRLKLNATEINLVDGQININGSRYYIVRYNNVLGEKEVSDSAKLGVSPLYFLQNSVWICAIESGSINNEVLTKLDILSVLPWRADFKLSKSLKQGVYAPWALDENGRLKLGIRFFSDVAQEEVVSVLQQYTVNYEKSDTDNHWWVVVEKEKLNSLAEQSSVLLIEPGPEPVAPVLDLSRQITETDSVHDINTLLIPPSYNLSGSGVTLQVSEAVFGNHPDFWHHDNNGNPTTSRLLNFSPWGSDHGTAVAGIIGGNGWNSDKAGNGGNPFQWRGIAPESTLVSRNGYGVFTVHASNHSFMSDCNGYSAGSAGLDDLISGGGLAAHPRPLDRQRPHIWAAANNGNFPPQHGDNHCGAGRGREGYYSIGQHAKNTITVGQAYANLGTLSEHGSLGPTLDGRIKPDVMAPGCKSLLPVSFNSVAPTDIDYVRLLESGVIVEAWEFNNDGDFEGWFKEAFTFPIFDQRVENGNLSYRANIYGGPYFYSDSFNRVSSPNQSVELRYRIANEEGSAVILRGSLFWQRLGSAGHFREEIEIIADGEYHTLIVPVGSSLHWVGTIDRLRLDIPGKPNQTLFAGGIVSTANIGGHFGYAATCGTSEAAPMVTGMSGLILQAFVRHHGSDIDNNPPLPSTIKAILVHTSEDMVHTEADPRDAINPDTGLATLYHEGPDFATGYGMVNAKNAADLVIQASTSTHIVESTVESRELSRYLIQVRAGEETLKVTLAWDDVEGATATDVAATKLVNNLDLILVDPEGKWHMPWRLDPLPRASNFGDFDPIGQSDVRPAYRGPDARNNVEQVIVETPLAGQWKVIVWGRGVVNVVDGPQSFSLVSQQPLTEITTRPFILTNSETGEIEFRLINADGSFAAPVVLSAAQVENFISAQYSEFAIADFNADHSVDFVASTNSNPAQLYFFERTGQNTFRQSYLFDLANDPKVDFHFAEGRFDLAPDYGLGLAAADIDNDGDQDLIEYINVDFGSDLYWIARGNTYLNNGQGAFSPPITAFDISAIFTGWTLAISNTALDVNNDGYVDAIASEQSSGGAVTSSVYVMMGMGDGTFSQPVEIFVSPIPASYLNLADVNNDGKIDALVGQDDDGDPGSVLAFYGLGDGSFSQLGVEIYDIRGDIESGVDQPGAGKFHFYDYDGDGDEDVISLAANETGRADLRVIRNDGLNGFDDANPILLVSQILSNPVFEAPISDTDELFINADFNGDRCVDRMGDLMMHLNHMRRVQPELRDLSFDLNEDGEVNISDARFVVNSFTRRRGLSCN